ncbi:MAG: hypothetical protein V7K26_13850 [Nostoc sp.]
MIFRSNNRVALDTYFHGYRNLRSLIKLAVVTAQEKQLLLNIYQQLC